MSTELTQRVITASVGAVVLLALVIFAGWPGICLLAAVVSLGMVYEFGDIVFAEPGRTEKKYVMLCAGWFAHLANFLVSKSEFDLFLILFFGLFIYFLFTASRYPPGADLLNHFKELMASIFGLVYLVVLPLFLTRIRDGASGVNWTIVFLLIVWAGDTGAYFAGKNYGRRKLFPEISPKKTVEGALGGMAAGLAAAVVYKLALFREMSWGAAILIPLFVGSIAQVGDLAESFLKRAFDKKDSGHILPGHGGFLDRFDGVVFGLPVMYACLRLLGG